MIKRTIYFSNPYHISAKNEQLVLYDKSKDEKQTVPIEDIGFIVFEHPQLTFTQAVLQLLAENNTAVVFCNNRFMPSSILFHLETNNVQAKIFRDQINASTALKNNLWQQTVCAKIKNQALLLKKLGKTYKDLLNLAKKVRSGDKENIEGQAARIYWPRLLGTKFRRERFGEAPNNLLNYCYAILRAAVSRALCGSGLLPTLGIFHSNKYNAFALADDIMEPYRQFVDELVYLIVEEFDDYDELNVDLKKELLQLLTVDVAFYKTTRPLMVGLSQSSASLVKCFAKENRKIEYPVIT